MMENPRKKKLKTKKEKNDTAKMTLQMTLY